MMRGNVLVFVLLAAVAMSHAAPMKVLHQERTTPGLWRETDDAVDTTKRINVSFGLYRRNIAMVEKILSVVSDPDHESYGQHLTRSQLHDLVRPDAAHLNQVLAWLRAHGLTTMQLSAMGDFITVEAPVALLEFMLHVKFSVFVHSVSRVKVTRSLSSVKVPENLASIIEVVVGFRSFPVESLVRTTNLRVRSPETDVTPDLLFKLYNVTATTPPQGARNIQSFFQAQGQYVEDSDLSAFCKQYLKGTDCKIAKYVNGNTPTEPGIESSLDSEYIMGNGRGVETWVWSYSNWDFCADLIKWGSDVMNLKAEAHPFVISMSYGTQGLPNMCAGNDVSRLNDDVMMMGTIGITVLIASGDDGSGQYSREGYNNGKLSPSWPASIPYATAVGSTTFVKGNSGEEMATTQFGSGGGFSYDYNNTKAQWQLDAVNKYFETAKNFLPKAEYQRNGRATPDVSTLGEGFEVISGGSEQPVGGTSASTPTFAGLVSLLNNIRLKAKTTMGFINPFLYKNPDAFFDTTKGTNAIDPSTIGWNCTAGWDPATGLGTPNFGKLALAVERLNARHNKAK